MLVYDIIPDNNEFGHIDWKLDARIVCDHCHVGSLTHWGRGKMAIIVADDFFKCIFSNKTFEFQIKIHWNMSVRV